MSAVTEQNPIQHKFETCSNCWLITNGGKTNNWNVQDELNSAKQIKFEYPNKSNVYAVQWPLYLQTCAGRWCRWRCQAPIMFISNRKNIPRKTKHSSRLVNVNQIGILSTNMVHMCAQLLAISNRPFCICLRATVSPCWTGTENRCIKPAYPLCQMS